MCISYSIDCYNGAIMDNMISPGRYVIAVSGGIDSMVLLHMLRSVERVELVVAHYDHGIRDDSSLRLKRMGYLLCQRQGS
jgi:tRNA(Ile)-lysidine synthase TilS/MesJ